ncbi:MAG: hypothetical protein LBF38_01745 [Deltaproteobacteria bacterium]|nr:hypothetical protein [Deltaproteobacteria bacterium]
MRIITALFLLFFFFTPALSAQNINSWKSFNTKNEPKAQGLNVTFKYPPTFSRSPGAKGISFVEFSLLDYEHGYGSYISMATLDMPPKFVDGLLKTTSGQWSEEMVDAFCADSMAHLDGAQSYTTSFYKGYPVCDFNIIQHDIMPSGEYRFIKLRYIIYNYKLISAQYGNVIVDLKSNKFNSNVKEECEPFYNSIELN